MYVYTSWKLQIKNVFEFIQNLTYSYLQVDDNATCITYNVALTKTYIKTSDTQLFRHVSLFIS